MNVKTLYQKYRGKQEKLNKKILILNNPELRKIVK